MPDTPPHPEVPARLQPALVDALADTELLRQRLDAAQQAAADFERHLGEAAKHGLIKPGDDLLDHCRTMTAAAQSAAGASFRVAEDIFKLRGEA
jgi:hypothetical protein